ncbi:MAG: hypothetical protein WCR67_01690 [Bacilli bacterium]
MAKKQTTTTTRKIGLSHLFFYIAGLLLVIKFLMEGGVPSPSANIPQFLVGIFTLIVIVGFYCFFVFGAPGCTSTIKALAPCMLLIILYGKYSMNFGNKDVTSWISLFASMAWTLIIVCGFVYLFVHNKVIGLTFTVSTMVYAAFIVISYLIMMIIDLTNGGTFNVSSFVSALLLVASFALISAGSYRISKAQSW